MTLKSRWKPRKRPVISLPMTSSQTMILPRRVVGSSKVTDSESVAAALSLLSASAVRERCHWVLDAARSDGLTHFRVNLDALQPCATLVANETRSNYPDLDVPYH
ncbi:MAG TPA: hypothetical protein DCS41_10035, partial [Gammaproteobacteria bacterium]|nr:hypothetical protein [Gammaproteobacteria bacterium]